MLAAGVDCVVERPIYQEGMYPVFDGTVQTGEWKKRNRIGENIIFYTAAKLFWCPDGLIVKRRCEIVCFSPGKTIRNKR